MLMEVRSRRRTDVAPNEDRAFMKGAVATFFLGVCCWAVLLILL